MKTFYTILVAIACLGSLNAQNGNQSKTNMIMPELRIDVASCTVDLSWDILPDLHNFIYEIQYSDDAIEFKGFMKVNPDGSVLTYHAIQEVNSNGIRYYRLRMVSTDGGTFEGIIHDVKLNCSSGQLKVYPNTTTDIIKVDVSGGTTESCIVYNSRGVQMLTAELTADSNVVDLNGMEAGLYYLVVQTADGKKVTEKVLKTND